jgi:hypothetical protein
MPYDYVEAEMLLEFRGVKVYHIYKNDMVDNGRHKYWYGIAPWCHEGDREMFDVRDIARTMNMPEPVTVLDITTVILRAINRGVITSYSVA